MVNLLEDQNCIAQLMSLGLVTGAVQHLDWRYEVMIQAGATVQAEALLTWYKETYPR